MLVLRVLGRFCRVKTYINTFDALENEVNQLESSFIEKREEVIQIRQITNLPMMKYWHREISKLAQQPYQYEKLEQKYTEIRELREEYAVLKEEETQKLQAAAILKKAEQQNAEEMFLTDLARFSQQFSQFVNNSKLDAKIQKGVELSHKALDKVLAKESVQWIGKQGEPFDKATHDRVEGTSTVVKEVLEKGFTIKDRVIDKAKIK